MSDSVCLFVCDALRVEEGVKTLLHMHWLYVMLFMCYHVVNIT